MEINILPQEPSSLTSSESQPSFHLHDIPRKMSMTTIDPGNDDWRVHSGLGVDNYGGGQNSDTLFYKYVNVDVDLSDKSERPEWAQARYHAYFSPLCAFQIQIQWMVSTGSLLGELIYSWDRKMTNCGFHLLPVPVDPFALPSAPDSDSLRGPIFIPLEAICLKNCGVPLFNGGDISSVSNRLYNFQVHILKRYGFIPAGVRDEADTMSPSGQGEDYSHFVHCTAGMFVLIEDSAITSPTSPEKPYSFPFSKKSTSELRKDYIKRQISSHSRLEQEYLNNQRIGFLWSWNFMSSKRWRTQNTGDEHFQDKVLADFRHLCSNQEKRLEELWIQWTLNSDPSDETHEDLSLETLQSFNR